MLFAAGLVATVGLNGHARATDLPVRPGFTLREVAAASGIRFAHQRPTLDPVLANISPHIAAVGAGVAVGDFNDDAGPTCTSPTAASAIPTRCT